MSNLVYRLVLILLATGSLFYGCTAYKSQEVPFKPPQAYTNTQQAFEASLAAQAYALPKRAKAVFGFDILKAGLLPVQVIIDNQGSKGLRLVPDQTFLLDQQGRYWGLLPLKKAYSRLEESDEFARIAKKAGKTGFLGAAGGAIIGAAIGILGDEDLGRAIGKGAAVGAAGGSVLGGSYAASSNDPAQQISDDLARKKLENKTIDSGDLARGFLFFPAEAVSATGLRLQVECPVDQSRQTLDLKLGKQNEQG
jgi:hypothetical protein